MHLKKLFFIWVLVILTINSVISQIFISSAAGYSLTEDKSAANGYILDIRTGYNIRQVGIALNYTHISNPKNIDRVVTQVNNKIIEHEGRNYHFSVNGIGLSLSFSAENTLNEGGLRIEALLGIGTMFYPKLMHYGTFYNKQNDLLLIKDARGRRHTMRPYLNYGFRLNYGLSNGLNIYTEIGQHISSFEFLKSNDIDIVNKETGESMLRWRNENHRITEIDHYNINLGVCYYFLQ
jgi:hypothetical protein